MVPKKACSDERQRTATEAWLLPATFLQKSASKRAFDGGNLVGKTHARAHNTANLLKQFVEFGSSPGHQFFINNQNIILPLEKPLE